VYTVGKEGAQFVVRSKRRASILCVRGGKRQSRSGWRGEYCQFEVRDVEEEDVVDEAF